MKNFTDSVIVSCTYNKEKDTCVLLVGHKEPRKDVDIVGAFEGKEALDIWNKLMSKKGDSK